MPAMSPRGRGRRAVNEINMVPFIDVMLVLLIIFMVTAPMITTGTIDVPRAGQSSKTPESRMELELQSGGVYNLLTVEGNRVTLTDEDLSKERALEVIKTALEANPGLPVGISADKGMSYEEVVNTMNELHALGVERVGLTVKRP